MKDSYAQSKQQTPYMCKINFPQTISISYEKHYNFFIKHEKEKRIRSNIRKNQKLKCKR